MRRRRRSSNIATPPRPSRLRGAGPGAATTLFDGSPTSEPLNGRLWISPPPRNSLANTDPLIAPLLIWSVALGASIEDCQLPTFNEVASEKLNSTFCASVFQFALLG